MLVRFFEAIADRLHTRRRLIFRICLTAFAVCALSAIAAAPPTGNRYKFGTGCRLRGRCGLSFLGDLYASSLVLPCPENGSERSRHY
jgi:hypothetical protein